MPHSAKELFEFAFENFKKGKYQIAVDAYRQSLTLKEDWRSYKGLGGALCMMQQYQVAVDAYNRSLALKEDWGAYGGMGDALCMMQQYQAAVDSYRQSLALQEHWITYKNLGGALCTIHQYQKGIDAFKQSLALNADWSTYKSLAGALSKTKQYQAALDSYRQSLALKEDWQTYKGLGGLLSKMQRYQAAVKAFKQSLALKEDWQTYKGLGGALYGLGKWEKAVEATRIFFKHVTPHFEFDPLLGERQKVTVTNESIQKIQRELSKIEFAFHPSFLSEVDEDVEQLKSWRNLIHVHIPKCAGSNFQYPFAALSSSMRRVSTKKKNADLSSSKSYLWAGSLGSKYVHDAFILEAMQSTKLDAIKGSFFSNHEAKHSIYCQKLSEAGLLFQKICLVRDPSKRLYSHIRQYGRTCYSKHELLKVCVKQLPNVMDRYIYDYDLFEGSKESPYCDPTDYENCNSINFVDISDDALISKIKSSFLSATWMPNIVQYNRLNDDQNKNIIKGSLVEGDFQDVYRELIKRGCLERDNMIDFEYLKKEQKEFNSSWNLGKRPKFASDHAYHVGKPRVKNCSY